MNPTIQTTIETADVSVLHPRPGANKTPKIYNGRCQSAHKGFRQLSFREINGKWSLCPVPFLAGNGLPGEMATTQEIGDLTIRYDWNQEYEGLSFLVYPQGPSEPPMVYKLHEENFLTVWRDIRAEHPWVSEFLERQVSANASSIIPVSVIPATEYEANKKKAAEVAEFAKRFGIKLPFDTNDIPLENLQLRPGRPLNFKEYQVTNVKNIDGTPGRSERWWSSLGVGALELTTTPRVLQINSDPRQEEIVLSEGRLGLTFNSRARILIRVVVGAALSRQGFFFGGSVHAYNLHWNEGGARSYRPHHQPKAQADEQSEEEAQHLQIVEPTNPYV